MTDFKVIRTGGGYITDLKVMKRREGDQLGGKKKKTKKVVKKGAKKRIVKKKIPLTTRQLPSYNPYPPMASGSVGPPLTSQYIPKVEIELTPERYQRYATEHSKDRLDKEYKDKLIKNQIQQLEAQKEAQKLIAGPERLTDRQQIGDGKKKKKVKGTKKKVTKRVAKKPAKSAPMMLYPSMPMQQFPQFPQLPPLPAQPLPAKKESLPAVGKIRVTKADGNVKDFDEEYANKLLNVVNETKKLQKQRQQLEQDLNTADQNLKAINLQLLTKEEKIQDQDAIVERIERELQESERKKLELLRDIERIEREKGKVDGALNEFKDLIKIAKKERDDLVDEYNTLVNKYNDLDEKLQETEKQKDDFQAELNATKEEIRRQKEEKGRVDEQLKNVQETLKGELEKINDEQMLLIKSLDDKRKELDDVKGQFDTTYGQLKEIKKEKIELEKENAGLKIEYEKKMEEIKAKDQEILAKKADLDQTTFDLSQKDQELIATQGKLDFQEQILNELNEKEKKIKLGILFQNIYRDQLDNLAKALQIPLVNRHGEKKSMDKLKKDVMTEKNLKLIYEKALADETFSDFGDDAKNRQQFKKIIDDVIYHLSNAIDPEDLLNTPQKAAFQGAMQAIKQKHETQVDLLKREGEYDPEHGEGVPDLFLKTLKEGNFPKKQKEKEKEIILPQMEEWEEENLPKKKEIKLLQMGDIESLKPEEVDEATKLKVAIINPAFMLLIDPVTDNKDLRDHYVKEETKIYNEINKPVDENKLTKEKIIQLQQRIDDYNKSIIRSSLISRKKIDRYVSQLSPSEITDLDDSIHPYLGLKKLGEEFRTYEGTHFFDGTSQMDYIHKIQEEIKDKDIEDQPKKIIENIDYAEEERKAKLIEENFRLREEKEKKAKEEKRKNLREQRTPKEEIDSLLSTKIDDDDEKVKKRKTETLMGNIFFQLKIQLIDPIDVSLEKEEKKIFKNDFDSILLKLDKFKTDKKFNKENVQDLQKQIDLYNSDIIDAAIENKLKNGRSVDIDNFGNVYTFSDGTLIYDYIKNQLEKKRIKEEEEEIKKLEEDTKFIEEVEEEEEEEDILSELSDGEIELIKQFKDNNDDDDPELNILIGDINQILQKDQRGSGVGDSSGLYNDEIDELMRKHKKQGFKGTYAVDQLSSLHFNPKEQSFSFVMNTEPSNVAFGHWVSIYVTKDKLEYFDPFGEEPSKRFKKAIKQMIQKWSPDNYLQFKINRIKFQRNNSNNCGYFAMKFLVDRYKGIPFKDATGFTKLEQSLKGEKMIKVFKKKCKDFGAI